MKRSPIRRKRKSPEQIDAYKELRVAAMDRSMGRCQRKAPCCWGTGSDVHHVKRRSQGGTDELSNVKWLCRPCHDHIHRNVRESLEQGWLRHA